MQSTIEPKKDLQHVRLSSGLCIVYRPMDTPVTYMGIAVGVGTRHERRGERGLAHFTEHMLFKGTRLRSSTHIIQRLEQIGGELNAYTSKEETILYGVFPEVYHYRALHLMCDIVQASRFPEEETRREQTVVIDEIASYEDSPSDLVWDEIEDILFKSHPLGHAILGTERSVSSFTPEKLRRFYERHYRIDNMVLFAQGRLDFDRFVSDAERLLTVRREVPAALDEVFALPTKVPTETIRRRGTHQCHVLLGGYGYSMHDPRRLALSILVNLLGGPGMSSRLNMALRERTGLVYHVECSYTAYSDTGIVGIYFGCTPASMERALTLVYEELDRLCEAPLLDSEVLATKRQLRGQLIVSADSREQTFLSMGKGYLHHGRVDSLDELCAKVDTVTVEDLYAVAQDVFARERFVRLIYK